VLGSGSPNTAAWAYVCVWVGPVVTEMPPAQLSVAVCSSSCSLQHNVIKEEGAAALAEALLTNRRLITLQ